MTRGHDDIDLGFYKLCSQRLQPIEPAQANLEDDVFAFPIAKLVHSIAECRQPLLAHRHR